MTSNWGIREEVRILENAFDEVSSKEEVYSKPALKKYGDTLESVSVRVDIYLVFLR